MRYKHTLRTLCSGLLILFFTACGSDSKDPDSLQKGSGRTIVETGELAAIESRSFVMQRYGRRWNNMKVIGILKHGTEVKAGDSIIQLDPTEINKYIIDREGDLETRQAAFEKLLVDQNNRVQDLASRLANEQAAFELKRLELQSTQFESDRIRQIKELEFKQAEINLNKVKRVIEHNKIIAASRLHAERINIDRMKEDIKSAYDLLPELTLRTPISGIFQIALNRRTNELVKIGDEIYQGNPLASVPDLTWMKVNTTVNEVDFLRVKPGQKVIVRLDAMPEASFEGEVSYVGKLCYPKTQDSRQKVFDVEVNILKSDSRLKPGMTVSCEFIES